jgi:hypothetical protein
MSQRDEGGTIPDDVAVKSDGVTVSLYAPGERKRDGMLESVCLP